MDVKFSVNRQSPAGPRIEVHVRVAGFAQTILITPEAARDVYARLGDVILDAQRAPAPLAHAG